MLTLNGLWIHFHSAISQIPRYVTLEYCQEETQPDLERVYRTSREQRVSFLLRQVTRVTWFVCAIVMTIANLSDIWQESSHSGQRGPDQALTQMADGDGLQISCGLAPPVPFRVISKRFEPSQ